jgi:acetyl-CoA C-acetyltransferase
LREAAIVATARTPIGKAHRGAFNDTDAPVLAAHVIRSVLDRAQVNPERVQDVILGCGVQWGSSGSNVARTSLFAAGLPTSIPGTTLDRKCGSGLTALAYAARTIMTGEAEVLVAGGVESISLTRNAHAPSFRAQVPAVLDQQPHAYMAMIETAELVAERYGISRSDQDAWAAVSHQRAAAAEQAGRFADEIVPIETTKNILSKSGETTGRETLVLDRDEGIRPDTTVEGLANLKPVWRDGTLVKEGHSVTAGNASQLSDGASAQLLMSRELAEAEGRPILGIFRGFQSAGCGPEEMGIGPVLAVPLLLERHGLTVQDVGLWELNEAFASQFLYCRDTLGISSDRINVDGGGIALGHPFGMTGSRLVGHALLEAKRRSERFVVVTMCVAGGMGSAGLFEIPE